MVIHRYKFAWVRLQMSSMLIQPCTYLDYRARLNIENEIRLTRYIKLTELRVDKKQRRIKENCHSGTRRRKTWGRLKMHYFLVVCFLIVHSSSQRSVPVFCMHKWRFEILPPLNQNNFNSRKLKRFGFLETKGIEPLQRINVGIKLSHKL